MNTNAKLLCGLMDERSIEHTLYEDEVGTLWFIVFKWQGRWKRVDGTAKLEDLFWLDDLDDYTNLTFEVFMTQVSRIMMKDIGMGADDVEDYDWHGEWEGENSPRGAYEEWKLIAGPDSGNF